MPLSPCPLADTPCAASLPCRLRRQINDVETLVDRHEKLLTADGPDTDLQTVAENCRGIRKQLNKCEESVDGVAKRFNLIREVLIEIGMLGPNGSTAAATSMSADRLRRLEADLAELQDEKAARRDVETMAEKLDGMQASKLSISFTRLNGTKEHSSNPVIFIRVVVRLIICVVEIYGFSGLYVGDKWRKGGKAPSRGGDLEVSNWQCSMCRYSWRDRN